jgi:Type I restriction modification DNA specificity domain
VRNEKGWEIGKLKDLAFIDRVQAIPSEFKATDFYIGLEDIEKETGNIIKTTSGAEELKSSKFRFTNKHILYAKLRPYLNKVALPFNSGICSTDIFPLLTNEEKANKYFVAYLMRNSNFVSEMNMKASGANLPRVGASVIENFKAYIPPISLQNQFAQIVQKTETLRAQYKASLQELQNLYGELSQKAFKGELVMPQVYAMDEPALSVAAEPAIEYNTTLSKKQAFLHKQMLASHIVYQLCDEKTFGHTKLMKLLYLCEQVSNMALQTNYKKFAAGPFDGKTLTLIDLEFNKNKWFEIVKTKFTVGGKEREATSYKKTAQSLKYVTHFENYFSGEVETINRIIELFRKTKTDIAEIVATLYYAWKEMLQLQIVINEPNIVAPFYQFHPEKKKFTKEQILDGYQLMISEQIYPI